MHKIFVISDTHFGHANILRFTDRFEKPLRTFDSVGHMNEHMVEKWNSVVRPVDKVYHLGDVLVKGADWTILGRLNGHKRLILGNHDYPKAKLYALYFEDIYSTRLLEGLLLSHIPIHPMSLGKARANVHGHVHNNVPALHFGPQYLNVSVEVIDYTPIEWGELKNKVDKQLQKALRIEAIKDERAAIAAEFNGY